MAKVRVLCLAGLFAATILGATAETGSAFYVQGQLRTFTGDSPPKPQTEARFDFYRNNLKWRLKIEYLKLPGRGPRYREFSGDGIDIYEVISWDLSAFSEEAIRAGNRNTEIGRVIAGNIPLNARPGDYAPWFAFAGCDYFESMTNQFMHNLFPQLNTNRVLAEAMVSDVSPRALANVRIYRPGQRLLPRARTLDGKLLPPDDKVYPPPFDQGFVGAEYTTVSWTNMNGYTFPEEFRLEYKQPVKEKNTGLYQLHTSDTIIGNIRSVIVTNSIEDFRPNVTANMTIIDERLQGKVGKVVYSSKQAGWVDR